jgi:hypothetical protein
MTYMDRIIRWELSMDWWEIPQYFGESHNDIWIELVDSPFFWALLGNEDLNHMNHDTLKLDGEGFRWLGSCGWWVSEGRGPC